jgi:hypothetical protein
MSTALALQPAASSVDLMPAMTIDQAVARYQGMAQFVNQILKQDLDYGTVPGSNKPSLLKPGAEKLTTFFGLRKLFVITEKIEDWTGAAHNGEPFFYYMYRCQLFRGEVLIAEADGSCNSFESKYRWRWVQADQVPATMDKDALAKRPGSISEFTFAVDRAETGGKYGKPAEYWQQFKDAIASGRARQVERPTKNGKSKAWEIDSTLYRVPNDDVASQVNTIQKMAQKRALVAATLLAVNASDYFTQDIEDYIDAEYQEVARQPSAPALSARQQEMLAAMEDIYEDNGGLNWAAERAGLIALTETALERRLAAWQKAALERKAKAVETVEAEAVEAEEGAI